MDIRDILNSLIGAKKKETDHSGLSPNTQKALIEMDKEGVPPPPEPVYPVAGTPLRPDQTYRHPNTGAPMTKIEHDALMAALAKRQVEALRQPAAR